MATSLVSTGIQFPDSTIQTTAASALLTISYNDRGNLRSTTPAANLAIIQVEGLGLFTYYASGQTEPDDDESCFLVTGGGSWILTSPTWDLVNGWQTPDWEYINTSLDELKSNVNSLIGISGASTVSSPTANINVASFATRADWPGRVVYVTVPSGITTYVSGSQGMQVFVNVPCLDVGDRVVVTPNHSCGWVCGACIVCCGYTSMAAQMYVTPIATNCAVFGYGGWQYSATYPACYYNLAIYKCGCYCC